jgi:peptidoglycan/LPS O-acetylase OafA/YrhL
MPFRGSLDTLEVMKTRIGLASLELVVALNAIGGAWYGLSGAPDVPREWLEGSPFDGYFVPSLILLVVVGGGMALALVAVLLRHPRAAELSTAAGLVLVGWIAVQVLIIVPKGGFSWLQPTMFAIGLVIAVLGRRLRTG